MGNRGVRSPGFSPDSEAPWGQQHRVASGPPAGLGEMGQGALGCPTQAGFSLSPAQGGAGVGP